MCRRMCPCLCFKLECCEKYFPEWYNERLIASFWCRLLIIILLAALINAGVLVLDQYVFDTGSTITWYTVVALALFFLAVSWLLVIYVEWQQAMFNLWVKVGIVVIYCGFGAYMIIVDLIGQAGKWETDTTCADIWTVIHFLAGPFFAILLPHWWMCLVVTAWEVLEYYTTGLGDHEIMCNRVVDIVVAIIGWWIVVLIFITKYIPWISSKNAYDDWMKDHPEHAGYEQSGVSDNDEAEEEDQDAAV
mmetsp:Transcript_37754/g.60491  ORF Transcript_37754/g.60491 Transcript_37754/m.60491 type:complete len:247 (-) Transcript_37754:48-788(-)